MIITSGRHLDHRGSVTIEAAFAIGSIGIFVSYCLLIFAAFINHLKCVDLSRELARKLAIDTSSPTYIADITGQLPRGATINFTSSHDTVEVRIDYLPTWLFKINMGASSVAFKEKSLAAN